MRERGGYGELLRGSRAFRLLWFAQIASLFGDWFNVIASSTLLAQLTGAGAALGALFAIRIARFVPGQSARRRARRPLNVSAS